MDKKTRREFLKKTTLTSIGLSGLPLVAGAAITEEMKFSVQDGTTILFQGDSITDAGRNRAKYYPNDPGGLGGGYAFQIIAEILGTNPTKDIKFYNRGISGNKVYQLAERWNDDCLYLKPDVLSIMIGVNDFWHTLSYGFTGTAETYENDFRKLLDRTKQELPNVKLIIGEPFAVQGGSAINDKWVKDFPAYQSACKNIASDFKAIFIPYQKIFDNALKIAPVSYWCPDGVHPSIAGAYLMKNAWLEAYSKI